MTSQYSKTSSQLSCEKYIYHKFIKSNTISNLFYGATVIHNIIYNEKSHIVARFKDLLIIDDLSEFLKRFYTLSESKIRLPKFFDYYSEYSMIFPNYTSLCESKYLYKNIHRKQKMLDLQQEEEKTQNEWNDDIVFNTVLEKQKWIIKEKIN